MHLASTGALAIALLAAVAPGQTINFARTDFPTALKVHDTAAGDLDGDGVLDLAAVGEEIKRVAVLVGTGGGSFAPFQLVPGLDAGPVSIVAGDLDGDAIDDLAVACRDADRVRTLRGVAGGLPVISSSHPVGDAPQWIVAADFDLDGDLDLATADGSVLLGDGLGGFGTATQYLAGSGTSRPMLTVTDCHADGDPDLVAAGLGPVISILHSDGAGGFTSTSASIPYGSALWAAAGDLDGDLLPDLITREKRTTDDDLAILDGNAAGTFDFSAWAYGVNSPAFELTDVTGDGTLDFVAVFTAVMRFGVWPGNSPLFWYFGAEQSFQTDGTPLAPPFTLQSAQLDGDGLPDVVVCYGSEPTSPVEVSVYLDVPPAPPTITSIVPATIQVLAAQPGGVAYEIAGSGFTSFKGLTIGAKTLTGWLTLAMDDDSAFSAKIFQNPLQIPLGPTTLKVTNSFGSASIPVVVVGPDPPALVIQNSPFSGPWAYLFLGAQPGLTTFLAASLDATPSTIPGLIDLGIGSGFTALKQLGAQVMPATGWFQKQVSLFSIPHGITIHFQFAVLDLAAPQFPMKVSNVATGITS